VYTERAEVIGRVHSVEVRAGEVTRLVLDWKLDSTLHTGSWVGFAYESPIEHRERRGMDAGRIATMLHEPYAIIVGLSSRGDGQYAFGLAVNPSGKVLVSGEVLLDDTADTDAILRHFALALSMRGAPPRSVPVQGIAPLNLDANPLPWIERPMVTAFAAQGRRQARWRRVSQVAIGIGVLGAAGSSALYLASPDDDHTMPTYDDRKTPAVEAFVGSSIVVGAGVYLYLRKSRSTSTVTAAMLGAGTTALLAGAMLYATDEDLHYEGWQRKTYRDSAVPGLIVGSAGVALTGVGIWLLTRDRQDTSMPLVLVERGSGLIGWAGQF
jgi:hypothetical protein